MGLILALIIRYFIALTSLEIVPAISEHVEHPAEETVDDLEREAEQAEESVEDTKDKVIDAVGDVADKIEDATKTSLEQTAADARHNEIMTAFDRVHEKLDSHETRLNSLHDKLGFLEAPIDEVEHAAKPAKKAVEDVVEEIEPEHVEAEVKRSGGRRIRFGRHGR